MTSTLNALLYPNTHKYTKVKTYSWAALPSSTATLYKCLCECYLPEFVDTYLPPTGYLPRFELGSQDSEPGVLSFVWSEKCTSVCSVNVVIKVIRLVMVIIIPTPAPDLEFEDSYFTSNSNNLFWNKMVKLYEPSKFEDGWWRKVA